MIIGNQNIDRSMMPSYIGEGERPYHRYQTMQDIYKVKLYGPSNSMASPVMAQSMENKQNNWSNKING